MIYSYKVFKANINVFLGILFILNKYCKLPQLCYRKQFLNTIAISRIISILFNLNQPENW